MEEEFWEIEDKQHGWYYLFQQLDQVARANAGTQLIAKEPMNIIRNRYRDVLPIDDTRVKLNSTECDYINANYVKEDSVQRKYIMTQGPMGHTCSHFWQMVWEQNCAGIVMLNRCIEKGMNKCFQYWPAEVGQSLQFGSFTIENQFQQTEDTFRLSMLSLSCSDSEESESKTVQHFHYVKWPDFNVPRTPDDFLQFLSAVRLGGLLSPEVGPCVVHCSAGIGRSGTFALVDVILAQIEKAGGTGDINIQQTLLNMRTQRLGLIQTPDQLRFSYIAILHGADRVLKGDDDEDSLSDEGVATEDSEEGDEMAGKERKAVEDDKMPPPLPPRHSDLKLRVEDNGAEDKEEDKEEAKRPPPPPPLKRTDSLSGSSSPSVTPEPPPIPARDDIPPPIPPRDKDMYSKDHFLEEREGNPSVNDIPSQSVEGSIHTATGNSLNTEDSMTMENTLNSDDKLRRREAHQNKQIRISSQVEHMKQNLQEQERGNQRGHSEQWTPWLLFVGVGFIAIYLCYRVFY